MRAMEPRALPNRPVIGVLHPGAMGAAVGSALKPVAGAVIWAAAGRSITTSKRAEMADLVGVADLADLALRSDVIVSVCPPDAARDVAEQVAGAMEGRERRPLYVDANAVSPDTVRGIGELLGAENVVDGSIIGPPAWEPGSTSLWLCGDAAETVAALFAGTPFAARVLDAPLGAASALKACYALQSKAVPALLLAMAEAADRYGVRDALRAELARSGAEPAPESVDPRVASKAWRWVGEMEEAGATLAAVGLPDGFSRAAAEVYREVADKDTTDHANEWGLRGNAR
jgi:3-hydroxyisobutyrate dehydrogenase-like beta-hydroxyacid dehydrogenase